MASRVDKIYGDAYISVKTDEDDLLEALEEAKAVKEILDSNTDFVNFLNHPQITKEEKMPLSQEQKDKILKKVIASSEYQKLEVTYETDKDIIGGLILCMDDRIVDNSIRTKLDSMGRYLSQIQL